LRTARTRAEAIFAEWPAPLDMFIVEGIHTSIPLHRRIMQDADFRAGNFDTKFMERFLKKPAADRPAGTCRAA